MIFVASVTVALGVIVATGFDIVCPTFSSEGSTFLAATLWTISLSVIIQAGFPDLSTMITYPLPGLPISFDTPATVCFSFPVIGGRHLILLTRFHVLVS